MSDGTYASYGPTHGNKKFGGCLNLNSKNFSSPSLQADLTEESKQGWSIPNSSPGSIVSHELGHGMHLNLCAKSCGLEYGKVPEGGRFNAAVHYTQRYLFKALNRRSQKKSYTWDGYFDMLKVYPLAKPKIYVRLF